ncbi:MAG: hypothetical protein ACYTF6_04545 [Planctomycetota bacterium]
MMAYSAAAAGLGGAQIADPSTASAAEAVRPTRPSGYKRADFGILARTGYGVGVRWTSRTLPRKGEPRPFAEAVAAFDVERFVERVVSVGPGHLMWAVCGSEFRFCCPSPVVDKLRKGRTSKRDLVMELTDALEAEGIKLMLAVDAGIADKGWCAAAGADGQDKSRFIGNLEEVIASLGRRYGRKVIAWWFENVRELAGWMKPGDWAALTAAAKAGFAGRLVGYNTGMQDFRKTTDCQDYSATWYRGVNSHPEGKLTRSGLPWYAMLDWHVDRYSIFASIRELDQPTIMDFDWPAPSAETLSEFYKRFARLGGTVTFNMLVDQAGRIVPEDLEVLREVRQRLRAEQRNRL